MKMRDILLDLRKERGISQQALANATGISQSTIAKIEVDRNEATASTIRKLSEFFNVSADYLLGLSEESVSMPGGVRSTVLSPDEEEILMLFRAMTKTQRTRLVAFGEGLLSGSDTWQKPLNRPKKA